MAGNLPPDDLPPLPLPGRQTEVTYADDGWSRNLVFTWIEDCLTPTSANADQSDTASDLSTITDSDYAHQTDKLQGIRQALDQDYSIFLGDKTNSFTNLKAFLLQWLDSEENKRKYDINGIMAVISGKINRPVDNQIGSDRSLIKAVDPKAYDIVSLQLYTKKADFKA